MTRKDFVRLTAGAACALPLVEGCDLLDAPEMRLCSKAELEEKRLISGKFNGKGVLMMELDGKWEVFSLRCRHKRCTVKWKPDERIFACPCHEGVYDDHGNVLDGPPPGPLYRFRWEERNGDIWVLNEKLND
jgi:cytochrome b6-f complex iron-sulfur subunit